MVSIATPKGMKDVKVSSLMRADARVWDVDLLKWCLFFDLMLKVIQLSVLSCLFLKFSRLIAEI